MPTKKMAVAPKVAALLRRVEKRILEEPRRFDMSDWVYPSDGMWPDGPPCGTVACIAGWVALDRVPASKLKKMTRREFFILGDEFHPRSARARACKALGIDPESSVPANLFGVNNWPDKYRIAYNNARTPKGHAGVAVRRIEHFIETGE